jgi:GNAT superfamily N-acetyltransferase
MIRAATHADLPRLLELGRLMHAESHYARLMFDADTVQQTLEMVLEKGFLFVHECDGRINAGMAAVITRSWFGPALIATDLALFVEPAARGGMAAPRLVKRYMEWAESSGADDVQLGVTTGVHAEKTGAFFERMGFYSVGGFYKKRANGHVYRA